MASCDALSPVADCYMITWPTSRNLKLAQLFKKLYILHRASGDSNLAIMSIYYSCQHISCIVECCWGRLPTPNFAPKYTLNTMQQHNF